MNAIDALQIEIEYQLDDLRKLALPPSKENCLFVGAGDSYVAGLIAQHVSGSRALCCYPTDVILNPAMASGRNVHVISVSGNTSANVLAAQAAKKRDVHTTAITARPDSRLAKVCDEIIELKYRSAGIQTAGTTSFTASMLTCISIAANVKLPSSLNKIYRRAGKDAKAAMKTIGSKKAYIILGNGILFPVAMHGALKFNEVFGAKAMPYPTEEFCHSPLFSTRAGDQVIIMGTERNSGKKLDGSLRQAGLSSVYVDCGRSDAIESLLQSIFFVQLLVLGLAHRRRLTDCYFQNNKTLLGISSDFIYG